MPGLNRFMFAYKMRTCVQWAVADEDFLRKARVNKLSDTPWSVRFDGLFLSHISILCWSFARWLAKMKPTKSTHLSRVDSLYGNA